MIVEMKKKKSKKGFIDVHNVNERRIMLVSRMLWNKRGSLRDEACRITGVNATVQYCSVGQWTWSLSTGLASGTGMTVEECRVAALEAILAKTNCLTALARLTGYRLAETAHPVREKA